MSVLDAIEKLRWYRKQAMESPLDSQQRLTWISICRDVEDLIKRMTPIAVGAICKDFDDIPW